MTPLRPYGDASVLQRTSYGARSHAQLCSYPFRGLSTGVELGSPVDLVALERPSVPFWDAPASDMAEDRRPVHPERCRQLLYRDALAVGRDELGHFAGSEAPLDREGGDKGVGRVDGRLTRALPQHDPERR